MAWQALTFTKGATTIEADVLTEGAEELPSVKVGSTARTVSGRLRSSIKDEKREWQFTHAIMSLAAYESLRTLVKFGAFVTVAGTIVNDNAGFLATVELGSRTFVEDRTNTDGLVCRCAMTVRSAA